MLERVSPYVRMAHHFPAGPDWRILPRVICDHLLLYTRDGSGRLTVGAETFRISPFSLFLVPPGVLHETTHDAGSPSLMYNLHFDYVEEPDSPAVPVNLPTPHETLSRPDWIRRPFGGDERLRLPVQVTGFAPAVYEAHFFAILGCLQSARTPDTLQAKGAMLQLLAHLYRSVAHRDGAGIVAADLLLRLDALPAVIEEHLHEPLSIRAFAEEYNLSETHFRRAFRVRFGVSPAAYVARCRLERARCLLLREAIPIKRVAEITGFRTVHHFTRAFAAAFGVPPARYRAMQSPPTP